MWLGQVSAACCPPAWPLRQGLIPGILMTGFLLWWHSCCVISMLEILWVSVGLCFIISFSKGFISQTHKNSNHIFSPRNKNMSKLEKCTEFSLRESKNKKKNSLKWREVNVKEREGDKSQSNSIYFSGLPLNNLDQFVLVLMRHHRLLVSLTAVAIAVCCNYSISVCTCNKKETQWSPLLFNP